MKMVITDEQLDTAIHKAYIEGYKQGYKDAIQYKETYPSINWNHLEPYSTSPSNCDK